MTTPNPQLQTTIDEFVKEYNVKPFEEYILTVNQGQINMVGYLPLVKQFDKNLKQGESLDDACINVFFLNSPPQDILSKMPDEYKGIRVVYQKLGNVKIVYDIDN